MRNFKNKMKDRAYCYYHDNKNNFKSAMSDIRKMLHIPQSKSKVCAMAICTCRKNVTYRTPMYKLVMFEYPENQDPNSHLSEILGCPRQDYQIGNNTRDFILGIISDAEKRIESAMRLYCILKMAVERDYTLLMEELNQTDRTPSEIKHVNKRKALCSILKKRKIRLGQLGHSVVTSIIIDKGDYKGVSKYDPGINDILQKTAQQNKPCIIEIDKEKRNGMPKYMSSVPVKIWCHSKNICAIFHQLRKELKLLPLNATQRRPYFKFFKDYHPDDPSEIYDPMVVKDGKSDDYCKRADKERSHRIRPLPGEKKSVKCYNCQKPLKTFPPLDDTKKYKLLSTECQYHPGFVQDGLWSCCDEAFEKCLPIAKHHAFHGCTFDSHKWLYQDHSYKSRGVKSVREHLNLKGDARLLTHFFVNTDY